MLSKNQAKTILIVFFTIFRSNFIGCSEETPRREAVCKTPPPCQNHSDGSIVGNSTPKFVRFEIIPNSVSAMRTSLDFFQQGPPEFHPRPERLTAELVTIDPVQTQSPQPHSASLNPYEEIQPNEKDVDHGIKIVNEKLSSSKASKTKAHLSIFTKNSPEWHCLFDTYADCFAWHYLVKRLERSGYFEEKPNPTKERLLEAINLVFKPLIEMNGTGEFVPPRHIWYNLDPGSDSD